MFSGCPSLVRLSVIKLTITDLSDNLLYIVNIFLYKFVIRITSGTLSRNSYGQHSNYRITITVRNLKFLERLCHGIYTEI